MVQVEAMTIAVSNVHHIYARKKTRQTWRRLALVCLGVTLITSLLWVAYQSLVHVE
jgi:hypothetical protein